MKNQPEHRIEEFFTTRQYEILQLKVNGEKLTKTEGEYFSRIIKKKLKKYAGMNAKWASEILIYL